MIKVEKQDYENWIQEIRKIKSALQVVFDFGKGFFGSHPKLMDVQEGIDKLEHLAEFLEKIMPKTPEYSKDPSGRWSGDETKKVYCQTCNILLPLHESSNGITKCQYHR